MWMLLGLILISPDSWSNARDLSPHDLLRLFVYALYFLRQNIWLDQLYGTLAASAPPGLLEAIPFLVYEALATFWGCLLDFSDVYMMYMTSLSNVDLEEIGRARLFELRVSRKLDIGVGREIVWACWIRKHWLKAVAFALACRNAYVYYLLRSTFLGETIATTQAILTWLYPAVNLSIYWSMRCLPENIQSDTAQREKLKLRAFNAAYCLLTGEELNTTRSLPNPALTQGALIAEGCRLVLVQCNIVNQLLTSSNATAIPSRVFAMQDTAAASMLLPILTRIADDDSLYTNLLHLEGEKIQVVLDILQKVSDSQKASEDLRDSVHYAIMRLCATYEVLPRRLILRGCRLEASDYTAIGGFGEIWRGSYGILSICMKIPKPAQQNNQDQGILKSLKREAIIWSRLRHPNVLPFYGVYSLESSPQRMALVSPWEENGNINDYLKNHPETAHFPMILEITAGLKYLHEHNIVHGDLKGANILVSNTGSARLADFGISLLLNPRSQLSTPESINTSVSQARGTLPWMAPELVIPPNGSRSISMPTLASDVYSLASVIYEVLTGKTPYYEAPSVENIMFKRIRHRTPLKPLSFKELELSEEIWEIMERCWSPTSDDRPPLFEVAQTLNSITPTELTQTRISLSQAIQQSTGSSPRQEDQPDDSIDINIVQPSTVPLSENILIREYVFAHLIKFVQQQLQKETALLAQNITPTTSRDGRNAVATIVA
ncbi:hypothetical protein D9756_006916 [Leucocoprinus leucothites]|uniref:Protein kinase domain-containing protein n=1 Tax=Leucocoprinus leucothites TaxID=201217 RepID=A0A8H5D5N0_9AGAR|nr:hypothetical protein D9756_006916 [Leucoagaricus leucothites]